MARASNKKQSNKCVKYVTVRSKPGELTKCLVRFGNQTIYGSIGRSGKSIFKREGDGATPIASMRVLYGFFKPDLKHAIKSKIKLKQINANDGWCDEPEDSNYNQLIRKPFAKSHETMLRNDILYDYVIVLDWNITSRKRHRGSAIFFHVAKPGYRPTEGCIAISKRDMARLLPYLTAKTRLIVR